MSHTATAPRVDLVENLLRRALDPAAEAGEARNAADKLVTIARREGVEFGDLAEHIGRRLPPTADEDEGDDVSPIEALLVLRFGQHRGRLLRDVFAIDPGYVEWLASECSDRRTREAATAVLRWKRGGR